MPIILEPSDNLLDGILAASTQGEPLLLRPGAHETQGGVNQKIPIGPNGLRLRAASDGAVIRRPDQSIDLDRPDNNFGLHVVPAEPTAEELAGITWLEHTDQQGNRFEFGIVIRGTIEISRVVVDCNMGQQQLELVDRNPEHSAMLAFAGARYAARDGPELPRRVYVAFEQVTLRDLVTINGGYADDIWITRGYFNPNIARVLIERVTSERESRLNLKRATVGFSAVCQEVDIRDARIYKLEMEQTTKQSYHELPRSTPKFQPAVLRLAGVTADRIDLAAKGKVYQLDAQDIVARESIALFQAGGTLRCGDLYKGEESRLFRLNNFEFEDVTWHLQTRETGEMQGLRPYADNGDSCDVSFRNNTFLVTGNAQYGGIITSGQYSRPDVEPDNRVTVSLTGCTYPEPFGRSEQLRIAVACQRGHWTFARADLGDRDPELAIHRCDHDDIIVTMTNSHREPQQWAEVPPVDLAELSPDQFADDELELPYYLAHLARVANAVVEEGENRGLHQHPCLAKA